MSSFVEPWVYVYGAGIASLAFLVWTFRNKATTSTQPAQHARARTHAQVRELRNKHFQSVTQAEPKLGDAKTEHEGSPSKRRRVSALRNAVLEESKEDIALRNDLISRCTGLLLACAIGDAKGIPFEGMSRDEILSLPNLERQRSCRYTKCTKHPKLPNYGPGKWTDDTQLSLAMARSFIRTKGRFDMDSLVSEHISAWRESTSGWGGTRHSIEMLSTGTSWDKSGRLRSTGNGVMMKLCPLAMLFAFQPSTNSEFKATRKKAFVEMLTHMTHKTPSATMTAILFCDMVERLYRHPTLLESYDSRKDLLKWLVARSVKLEHMYLSADYLETHCPKSERDSATPEARAAYRRSTEVVSPGIRALLSNFDSLIEDEVLERISNGGSYFCVHSLVMVIGLLVAEEPSFATIERACFIGGDTDSNAAMVGAILGGMYGTEIIKDGRYVADLDQHERLREAGEQLGRTLFDCAKA